MPRRITKAIVKSTNGDKIPEMGIIKRGKYTFVMMFEFEIMLFVERVMPSAKSVQGSNAA
jgi:hypothetical protein